MSHVKKPFQICEVLGADRGVRTLTVTVKDLGQTTANVNATSTSNIKPDTYKPPGTRPEKGAFKLPALAPQLGHCKLPIVRAQLGLSRTRVQSRG